MLESLDLPNDLQLIKWLEVGLFDPKLGLVAHMTFYIKGHFSLGIYRRNWWGGKGKYSRLQSRGNIFSVAFWDLTKALTMLTGLTTLLLHLWEFKEVSTCIEGWQSQVSGSTASYVLCQTNHGWCEAIDTKCYQDNGNLSIFMPNKICHYFSLCQAS